MNDTVKTILHFVEFALILVIAGYLYFTYKPALPSSGESVIAKEAPAVKGAPLTSFTVKGPVKGYGGKAKEKAKLPPAIQQDPNKELIAATQTPSSLRPTTTSTVIDKETGQVQTFTKVDPYPWLSWEPRGEVGIAYGYKSTFRCASFSCDTDSKLVARLQFGYDVLRIKALTAGITATVDSDRDAFVGARIRYQW